MPTVCYIFRKPGFGYSIETLFDNIIRHLPPDITAKKIRLPYHTGITGRLKNLLFLRRLKNCDIFHITGDVYYAALALPGNKTIITYHDLGSLFREQNFIKKQIIKLFWLKLPIKKAIQITVISKKTHDELKQLFPQVITKTSIIPNCIEDRWFAGNPPETKQQAETALVIGTKPNKSLQNIAIAAKLAGIKLIVVGNLNRQQKQWLQGITYANHKNLTRQQLRKLYLAADFLLFPSLYEGFGLPVIEAQALGLPVITSDIEPLKTVSGGAALLVNPENPQDIANAIQRLKNDVSLRENLIRHGFKNAQNYRCSKIAQLYVNLYKSLFTIVL